MEGGDAEISVLDYEKIAEGNNGYALWVAGALAKDGCIYYLPFHASRVLKLDPHNHDSLSLVGEDLEDADIGVVVLGGDECIYGIPSEGNNLIKYDPLHDKLSIVQDAFTGYHFNLGGVLGADGNIYAANGYGQIIKIDTATSVCTIIGCKKNKGYNLGWGSAVLGADMCIYFPPHDLDQVLKFNPSTHNISLIGDSYGSNRYKWCGGVLASNGNIYYVPYSAKYILQVDAREVNEQMIGLVQNINETQKNDI